MKKISLILLSLSFFVAVKAQKLSPEIKVGSVLYCSAFVGGQEFPLILTINDMKAPVIGWSVEGYGDGTFEMSTKALESATKMPETGQPSLGATKLGEDETFGLISKAAYKSLVDNKTFTYNGLRFKAKVPAVPMKFGDKEVNVTHVISEDNKLELWILNNAAFPLVLQSAGMPTDIVVKDIK